MNIHMAKKWPEKVVQRSFIKGNSFQTVFRSRAERLFHGTENEIWASSGQVGNTD